MEQEGKTTDQQGDTSHNGVSEGCSETDHNSQTSPVGGIFENAFVFYSEEEVGQHTQNDGNEQNVVNRLCRVKHTSLHHNQRFNRCGHLA